MYQSGRVGDEAKTHKSPANSGRVGIITVMYTSPFKSGTIITNHRSKTCTVPQSRVNERQIQASFFQFKNLSGAV